nr:PBS lyase HEAT domain protein repeat-containing protein [Streptomyces tsukubensis NRRL18488]
MFGGIDEVEWAGLEHAYGSAGDVPGLLRGLASADPAVRESALDAMYGAVHHQGDVYDSTLACIPFLLELVVDPAVPDRGGIIELLTSIGGIELDGDDELDPECEEFESAANYAMAASAVTAGADAFLSLVGCEDRGVRLTVPLALAAFHGEPALVLALLRERLKVESDPEVRLAYVEAGGRIALRHDGLAPEVVEWLTALTRSPHDGKPSVYDPDAYAVGLPPEPPVRTRPHPNGVTDVTGPNGPGSQGGTSGPGGAQRADRQT